MFVVVSSPKGGCGASVVSTALAALLSTAVIDRDRRLSTRLVDLGGDQPAILGVAWASGGGGAGKIGDLFDQVIDNVMSREP